VVPVTSALWNITDRTVVANLYHTDMTSSQSVFSSWVVPHLAIGPSSGSSAGSIRRLTSPRLAGSARAARTRPKPAKLCRSASGTLPSLDAAGTLTATRAGVTRTFMVPRARSFTLTLYAPDTGITLKSPSGKTIDRDAPSSPVAQGSLFQSFTVHDPASGRWSFRAQSTQRTQPAAYALQEQGATAKLTATLTVTHDVLRAVSAHLIDGHRPPRGAKLTAAITLPNGKTRTLKLRPVAHHPGVYHARLHTPLPTGTLPLQATIHAQAGTLTLTALATQTTLCT
jgi:hypothetical protein